MQRLFTINESFQLKVNIVRFKLFYFVFKLFPRAKDLAHRLQHDGAYLSMDLQKLQQAYDFVSIVNYINHLLI